MSLANKHIILCNDAKLPTGLGRRKSNKIIELNHTSKNKNVEIKLLDFITRLNYLPNSIKDLLEIATYVYAADRSVLRGTIKDVEFQSWSRNFHFVFKVRDIEFWNKDEVRDSLSDRPPPPQLRSQNSTPENAIIQLASSPACES